MREELVVTLIGSGLVDFLFDICRNADINNVNLINKGMLGNFNTSSYSLELEDTEVFKKRAYICNKFVSGCRCMALIPYDDGLSVYILDKSRLKHTL